MKSIKNSNVTKEVERLLSSVKVNSPSEFNILMDLIDEVYDDPKISYPETITKDIENKLYQWIDNSVNLANN